MSKHPEGGGVTTPTPIPQCPRCQKPEPLCICDSVTPVENRLSLLILQHPQEQDRALGTARLAALHFNDAAIKIGLSWPSLSRALGRPVHDPLRWAALYLGSAKVADFETERSVIALDRKGALEQDQCGILRGLEGVVVLDGSWSQVKALWWRNAWLLKCQRVILSPQQPSRYGKLRREPRRDGLSTIEAAAMLIGSVEQRPDIETALYASFEEMLAKYRQAQAEFPQLRAPPARRRDFRRRQKS